MSFQNPGLLLAGLALVVVPLVIHLLNRRRVKVVEWAAMDFLLEADQRNRRRVLLENLLLLLLRCLAVALLALVVGRPLLTSALAGRLGDAAPLERLVLLDDSLSMQSSAGATSTFELARDRLIELCRQWAAEPGASVLTLRVTSRPDDPVLQGGRLATDRIEEVVDALRRLEPTDLPAALSDVLAALDRDLDAAPPAPRLVYLVTDLRQRDWRTAATESEIPAAETLGKLARRTQGAVLIDVGTADDGNLVLSEIEPEGILAVDVPSRLTVSVWNTGSREARDLEVKFTSGDAVPLVTTIEQLAPGELTQIAFTVTFPGSLLDEGRRDATVPVRAEVISNRPGTEDRLTTDSAAYLAANVRRGIPVLIVDGDPSSDYGRSESFYLTRALAPPGSVPSGIAPDVITTSQFESQALDAYRVICLCNVAAIDEARRELLADWVRAGGGLAFFPGDECDDATYNAGWYRDGLGLSPVQLKGMRGDESERTWVTFRVDQPRGGFLSLLAGDDNPLLQRVKTFRWWVGVLPAGDTNSTIAARWTDAEESPAVVERSFGAGRVVWLAGPADADWSNWSSDPSYLVVMQELVRWLAAAEHQQSRLRVGQTWRVPIDLAEYRPEATLRTPRDERLPLVAHPGDEPSAEGPKSVDRTIWNFVHRHVLRQGFYGLELTAADGSASTLTIAANIDPSEGDLRRADAADLRRQLGDAPVTFVDAGSNTSVRRSNQETEIWWYLAWGLAGILGLEQLLAWRFGRNRG